jgi:hypothetical protein
MLIEPPEPVFQLLVDAYRFHRTKHGKQTKRSWVVYRAAHWTMIYHPEFHERMVIRVTQVLRSTGLKGLHMENYPAKKPVDKDV